MLFKAAEVTGQNPPQKKSVYKDRIARPSLLINAMTAFFRSMLKWKNICRKMMVSTFFKEPKSL